MARIVPVAQVLQSLQQGPEWRKAKQFLRVLEAWASCVGPGLSRQCQPQRISEGILWVATVDGIWAQQLTYERELIRRKLLAQLPGLILRDIRFTPTGWQTLRTPTRLASRQPTPTAPPSPFTWPATKDPQERLNQVTQVVRWRLAQWPLCPRCRRPTHPTSIERWRSCAPCHSA